MADEIQLDELTLKELQDKLTGMDFEGAENFTSKAQVIAVIKSLEKREVKANKAVAENSPVVNDNVKEDADHHAGKALAMKQHLEAQPKVPYAIPLGIGEKKGAYETVTMNGYRLSILKGVIVYLPQQVVTHLMESYNETAAAGQDMLLEANEAKKARLVR